MDRFRPMAGPSGSAAEGTGFMDLLDRHWESSPPATYRNPAPRRPAAARAADRSTPETWIQRLHHDNKEFQNLRNSYDLYFMRNWIINNFHKVWGYGVFSKNFTDLLKSDIPERQWSQEEDPTIIVETICNFFKELIMQWNMADVSFKLMKELEGTTIYNTIYEHKTRMADILRSLKNQVTELQEKESNCIERTMELQSELAGAEAELHLLKGQTLPSLPTESSFILELRRRLKESEFLQSTLRHELDRQESMNKSLKSQLIELESMLAMVHQEKVLEAAEVMRDVELNEALIRAITDKIQSLSPNAEEVRNAISGWLNEIESALQHKRIQIEELKDASKSHEEEIAKQAVNLSNLSRREMQLQSRASMLNEAISVKEDDISYLENLAFESPQRPAHASDRVSPSSPIHMRPSRMSTPKGWSPAMYGMSPSPGSPSPPSPAHIRPSRTSTPKGGIPDICVTSPTPRSPGSPSLHEPAPLLDEAVYLDEISSPEGAHMMECHGSGSVPRTESTPPQSKTPSSSKADTSLRESIVLRSPNKEQPMVVNINVDPKPLIQTPGAEHFVVDISLELQEADEETIRSHAEHSEGMLSGSNLDGVDWDSDTPESDPTPVIETSIHNTPLPPVRRRIRRHRDLVPTYNQPPAVTPTTARRHGMFTPRSVFQRGHFNVRRILEPFDEDPSEYPASQQPLDQTILWEHQLTSDGNVDTSAHPPRGASAKTPPSVIERSQTPQSTRTDSTDSTDSSPLLHGTLTGSMMRRALHSDDSPDRNIRYRPYSM